ncbi:CHAT domain-containing tetratricopeptide repeat protein [Paraflavisolibacter sp. H34]|uniref:CHAT domain-containing tetratricopeptide repeat protein n=1 Tax=Huijunlia imazamoxiresistens TaxID=3127457 RepID=UPI003015DFF9
MKRVLIRFFLFFLWGGGCIGVGPAAAQSAVMDSLRQALAFFRGHAESDLLRQAIADIPDLSGLSQVDTSLSQKLLFVDSLFMVQSAPIPSRALSYAEALSQVLQPLPPAREHPDYGLSLCYLAALYAEASLPEKALPLALQAQEILKKAVGEQHADYAQTLLVLGHCYKRLRLFDTALPYYQQALALRSQLLGTGHPDYSGSLYALGLLFIKTGQYGKALPMLQQALATCERSLGRRHPNYASILKDLADVYKYAGQFDKALPLYQQALGIRKQALGDTHPEYINSLYKVGLLYADVGQYEKALPLLQQALELCRKIMGEEDPNYANILKSLGLVYQGMGQLDKALQYYRQSLVIRKKILGNNHPSYGTILKSVANVYKEMGQYDKALPLLQEAVETSRRSLGEDHPGYGRIVKHLASLYTEMGQYDKALPLYQQVLTIYRKTYGEEHPYAASLGNLANLYMKQGRYDLAKPLFEQALAIIRKALGENSPSYAVTLKNLALLYTLMDRSKEAADLFIRVSGITLQHLHQTYTALSEQEKIALLNKEASQFCYLPSLVYKGRLKDPSVLRQVYAQELALKGMVLEDQQQVLHAIRKSGDTATLQLFEQWRFYNSFIGRQLMLPKSERATYLDSLREETNGLEQQLSRRAASFRQLQHSQAITAAEIAQKLQPGEAAVEFLRFRLYHHKLTDSVHYAALVLLPGDSAVHFVPLFEERQLLRVLQPSLTAKSALAQYVAIRKLYDKPSGPVHPPLYRLVWKPLERYLAGARTVYYAPAGLLHRIAFQALRPDATHALVDRYQLRQVLSTRAVALPAVPAQKPLSVALWGNINYNTGTPALGAGEVASLKLHRPGALLDVSGGRGARGGAWGLLSGAKEEVDSLGRLLQRAGVPITTDSGTVATEEAFKALSGRSAQVLHLATHGFFLPVREIKGESEEEGQGAGLTLTVQQNPMFRSGLVLAGANQAWTGKATRPGWEDGILTAYEIAQLDLGNTGVVVLSACETALGEVQGNEGVIGLQRAFKLAGVHQLVMSLWRVPDEETMELMTLFYRNWLGGKSPREALHQAQLKMKEKYSPYYWAGFVVVE